MAERAHIDAAVVASAREGGARIVGKTRLTELCWSANGINHWAGTPVNPRDPRRLPGGSSSGSAVAVATGEADVAFGTDTGGSVRVPAACCGVVGLKTTHGRISVKGVYPLAPSLDTVGPLGADVAAVELGMRLVEPAFQVPPRPARWSRAGSPRRARRRGRPGDRGGRRPGTRGGRRRGHARARLDADAAVSAIGVIIDSEGFRSNAYLMPYLRQLSPHVRRNLERGARLARADRLAAERTRAAVRGTFEALLADFPVLVVPTLLPQPPLLGEHGFSLTALTAPVSLAGPPRARAAGARARRHDRVHAGDRGERGAGTRVRTGDRGRRPPLSARLTHNHRNGPLPRKATVSAGQGGLRTDPRHRVVGRCYASGHARR